MKKLPSFSSIIGWILIIILIIAGISLYYGRKYAQIGAGFAAKQMCSCLYVQNRTEDECKKEMNAELGNVAKFVDITYFPEKVIVSISGLYSAQSKLDAGFGCSAIDFNGKMPNGLNN